MFWFYQYKGFSHTAAHTVHTALVLAGQQGCSQADTGHLLLALVQTARGTAADFLSLMAHVQQVVRTRTGVQLEPEVCILGEDAPAVHL